MTPETIIDLDTKARYKLEDKLGEGATSIVYRARRIAGEGDSVIAAKIAHPNLPTATLADFRAEREKIAQLWRHTNCVPWAHPGQDPRHPELEIVLLEFIPPEWQLSKIAKDHNGQLPEEIALQSWQQAAQLLIALHEQTRLTMRGDRKLADPHWDTVNKRLVILDWNRAQPLPLEDAKERTLLIRQDIRIFAHLWAQLLFGLERPVPTRLEVEDAAWNHLSFGTRLVFTRAFGRTPWGEYANARQLADALDQQRKWFDSVWTNSNQLLEKAKQLKEHATSESTSSQRIALAEQVWILADLVERHAPRSKKQAQELIKWAQEVIERERAQIRSDIEKWRGDLTKGRFVEVARAVRVKLESIKQVAGYEESLAAMRRWQMVTDLAVTGNNAGHLMQEQITRIANSLQPLDDALVAPTDDRGLLNTIEQVQRTVDEVLNGLPAEVSSKARALSLELAVRRNWLEGTLAEDETNKTAYRESAWKEWEKLERVDSLQAQLLRTSLALFDDFAVKVISSQHRAQNEREFTEKAEQVFREVENAWEWLDVTDKVEEALRFYRDYLAPFRGNVTPSVVADLRILETLSTLARSMPAEISQRDEVTALAQIENQVPAAREGLKSALERLLHDSAQEHIGYLWDEARMRWPDELQQGLHLARAVQDQAAAKYFEMKIEKRRALLPCPVEALLSNFEDSTLDGKLTEAENERIELFDRGEVPPAEAEQLRVANLRAKRNALRLQSEINSTTQSLVDQMKSLIAEMQASSVKLTEKQNELNEKITTLDDALHRYQESIRAASEERLQSTIDGYEELLKRLSEVTGKLDRWSENWPHLHQEATRVNEQLARWKDFAQETELATAQVRTLYEQLTSPDITQAESVIQSTKPPLAEIVQGIYITAGLEAARRFDENDADKYLKLAKDAKPDIAEANRAGCSLLEEAIRWLDKQSPERSWCSEWKQALDKGDFQKADSARAALLKEDMPPGFWDFWLVRELNERHWVLTKKWLAEHKDDTARRAQARTDFVRQAAQALVARDLQKLQQRVDGYAESLGLGAEGYAPPEGLVGQDRASDLEVLSGWARRLGEAERIKERLKRADVDIQNVSKDRYAAGNAKDLLGTIVTLYSDEVFAAFYEKWAEELDALQKAVPDDTEISDYKKKGDKKQERGMKFLNIVLHNSDIAHNTQETVL